MIVWIQAMSPVSFRKPAAMPAKSDSRATGEERLTERGGKGFAADRPRPLAQGGDRVDGGPHGGEAGDTATDRVAHDRRGHV